MSESEKKPTLFGYPIVETDSLPADGPIRVGRYCRCGHITHKARCTSLVQREHAGEACGCEHLDPEGKEG